MKDQLTNMKTFQQEPQSQGLRLPPIDTLISQVDDRKAKEIGKNRQRNYPPSPADSIQPSRARSFASSPMPPQQSRAYEYRQNRKCDRDQYQLPSPLTISPHIQQLPPISNSPPNTSYNLEGRERVRLYGAPRQTWSTPQHQPINLPSVFGRSSSGEPAYPYRPSINDQQVHVRSPAGGQACDLSNAQYDPFASSSSTPSSFRRSEQGDYRLQRHASFSSMRHSPIDNRSPFMPNGHGSGAFEAISERPDFRGAPRKRRGNLPKSVTDILKKWLGEHLDHPYPTEEEKHILMGQTHMDMQQLSNWFINARRRKLKPMKNKRDRGEWIGPEDDIGK